MDIYVMTKNTLQKGDKNEKSFLNLLQIKDINHHIVYYEINAL